MRHAAWETLNIETRVWGDQGAERGNSPMRTAGAGCQVASQGTGADGNPGANRSSGQRTRVELFAMRWTPGGRSEDLEDDRAGGGSGFRLSHGMGLGGFLLLLVLSIVFKRDFFALFDAGSSGVAPTTQSRPVNDSAEETQVQFVSFVLDDTQKTWTRIMQARGVQYPHAKLVLFRDAVDSACGLARSATGPFYCPADQKVYIDLGFYDELKRRFGAPGDFAQAYVLAHEIGHHVQRLLGVEGKVSQAMRANPGARNDLSVPHGAPG